MISTKFKSGQKIKIGNGFPNKVLGLVDLPYNKHDLWRRVRESAETFVWYQRENGDIDYGREGHCVLVRTRKLPDWF